MTVQTAPPPRTLSANRAGSATREPRIAPYLMVAPMLIVFVAILGVPLVRLIIISLQDYRLGQVLGKPATWVGFDHYVAVFTDHHFWEALIRTVEFVLAAVGITIIGGLLLAQLLTKVSGWVRVTLLTSMVAVWSMPPIIAMPIWRWLIDQSFGVLNYSLWKIGILSDRNFNWFREPFTGWMIITAIVVWGALPFVVISLHAAMTAVSQEHTEAARLDGAGAFRLFRNVTFPAIKPTLLIITTLSIIWDYRVFAQVWLFRNVGTGNQHYYTISIWSYVESFSKKNFGYGAAIALVSVMLLATLSAYAVKHVLRATTAERVEK